MQTLGQYPFVRMRRMRHDDFSRRLMRETVLTPNDLILPVFVQEGEHKVTPVPTMPGVNRLSIDELLKLCGEMVELGIPMVALFPHIDDELKTPDGVEAANPDGLIPRAVKAIKAAYPQLGVMCDVALDPYTTHGQDGLIDETGYILNDETIEMLVRQVRAQAQAGADVVAPSDMMDGRVAAIRAALDENALTDIPIMSYSAKFASGYYSPFRDAAESAPCFGDRKSYQMDPCNGREALREIEDDIEEGADMVMVKPALCYLDILRAARDRYDLPIAAYNVSGEFSMVKAAAQLGWIDEKRIVLENLTAIKRAGADIIITYHALDAAKWIKEDKLFSKIGTTTLSEFIQ